MTVRSGNQTSFLLAKAGKDHCCIDRDDVGMRHSRKQMKCIHPPDNGDAVVLHSSRGPSAAPSPHAKSRDRLLEGRGQRLVPGLGSVPPSRPHSAHGADARRSCGGVRQGHASQSPRHSHIVLCTKLYQHPLLVFESDAAVAFARTP